MRKILIIVDMQEDFIRGALGSDEAILIVDNVKNRAMELCNNGYEVFCTRDTHSRCYLETFEGKHLPVPHCIMYSDGWQVIPELRHIPAMYINKETFGYESWKNWLGAEENIEKIELMGVCTDICVISNALALRMFYPNTEITVHENCCAGVTPEKHRAALEVMKSCQIDVVEGE